MSTLVIRNERSIALKIDITAIIAVIGGFLYSDNQKAERVAEERRKFEISRVSTVDPLVNLAGCMANNLTPFSEILMGNAIFDSDNNRRITEEQLRGFESARDALLKKCAQMYWQPALEKYRTVTYPMLHNAMFQVMREDPGVKAHIDLRSTMRDAMNSAYVKQ